MERLQMCNTLFLESFSHFCSKREYNFWGRVEADRGGNGDICNSANNNNKSK